jgi:hypothetical protein
VTGDQDLDGTTLRIYVALVNEGKPLGPRELTRIANLSSPSVAYRNLQKLEELDLVQKDAFGEYTVKQRQSVKGHFWVGGRLFPRLMFYSFFFVGLFSVELVLAALRLLNGEVLAYDFVLLLIVTGVSLGLFLLEGTLSGKMGRKAFQ